MLLKYFKKSSLCIPSENEIAEVLTDIENIHASGQEDDGDWEEVGPKNKSVVTRVVRFSGISHVIVSILKVFLVLLTVISYPLIINLFLNGEIILCQLGLFFVLTLFVGDIPSVTYLRHIWWIPAFFCSSGGVEGLCKC